jgi:hypothetical protein
MINDTTLANRLDSISRQLASIKHDTMFEDTTDTIKTYALVISPFLLAFIIFLLNRNKEYKVKKADLCGEIYACLEELKLANGGWVTAQINFLGFSRSFRLLDEGDFNNIERTAVEKIYLDSSDELKTEIEKMNTVIKNLRKYVGVYRFYLPFNKKTELDMLMEPITNRWTLEYDFTDLDSIEQVNNKLKDVQEAYIRDQTPVDQKRYKAIIDFIDDYEGLQTIA